MENLILIFWLKIYLWSALASLIISMTIIIQNKRVADLEDSGSVALVVFILTLFPIITLLWLFIYGIVILKKNIRRRR